MPTNKLKSSTYLLHLVSSYKSNILCYKYHSYVLYIDKIYKEN